MKCSILEKLTKSELFTTEVKRTTRSKHSVTLNATVLRGITNGYDRFERCIQNAFRAARYMQDAIRQMKTKSVFS